MPREQVLAEARVNAHIRLHPLDRTTNYVTVGTRWWVHPDLVDGERFVAVEAESEAKAEAKADLGGLTGTLGKAAKAVEETAEEAVHEGMDALTKVKGIGEATAEKLMEAGITSLQALVEADAEVVAEAAGRSVEVAAELQAAAQAQLEQGDDE